MTSDDRGDGRVPRASTRAALDAGLVPAVVALVVLVVLGAAVAGPWHLAARPHYRLFSGLLDLPTPPPQTAPPPPPPEAASGASGQGRSLTIVLVVIAVAVLVALVVVVARVLRRLVRERRPQPVDDDVTPGRAADVDLGVAVPALAQGVHAARRELARDVPAGDAVIAAWVALERSAQRSGVVRDPAQTPTEFTVALLDATRADPAATRGLLDVYLLARFSRHPLTAVDVRAAQGFLARLADGVVRPRDGDPPSAEASA